MKFNLQDTLSPEFLIKTHFKTHSYRHYQICMISLNEDKCYCLYIMRIIIYYFSQRLQPTNKVIGWEYTKTFMKGFENCGKNK